MLNAFLDLFSFLMGGECETEVTVVMGVTTVENKKRGRKENKRVGGWRGEKEWERRREIFQHLKLLHD